MKPLSVLALGMGQLLALGGAAQDPARTPVPDPRPVMLSALQAADGKAYGVLQGAMADAITRQFKARTPINIDVTTEKRYRQPGCARLQVLFWQDGVQLPGVAEPRRQTIAFGINYCLDGMPPSSLF